jgi:hypothetical protein
LTTERRGPDGGSAPAGSTSAERSGEPLSGPLILEGGVAMTKVRVRTLATLASLTAFLLSSGAGFGIR